MITPLKTSTSHLNIQNPLTGIIWVVFAIYQIGWTEFAITQPSLKGEASAEPSGCYPESVTWIIEAEQKGGERTQKYNISAESLMIVIPFPKP